MEKEKRSRKTKAIPALQTIQPEVAGVDVGSKEHWVCGPALASGQPNVRVFGTTTDQLKELVAWLRAQGVKSVAMESTGIYWIPLYELLESHGIDAVLANARQLHNVPGRKTDFADCQWIQLLHSCGLLRGSFRPGPNITAMRAIHRHLANLVEQRAHYVQWMQKALDQMNVQVHRAVTDLTGTTGMAIIRAIVAGERDPARLSALRDPRCGKSAEEIARYLTGTWRDEHLFSLASTLELYDAIDKLICTCESHLLDSVQALQPDERKDAALPPHPNPNKERFLRSHGAQPVRTALWRFAGVDLTRIDGISLGSAKIILTEIGPDLSAFPSEHHFVSWLRLCPRTPISGGKPLKKGRNGMGANRVANTLRMAASSLQRGKSALGASYRRIARKKGALVAVFATARRLAQLVYRMLRYGQDYTDIGEAKYQSLFDARRLAGLTEAARSLGYSLTKEPSPALT